MARAKVVGKVGINRVLFEAPGIHTSDECATMQEELGFNPYGYGDPSSLRIVNTSDGKATQWECYSSCD
jgi:hypothetical protein